MRSSGEMSNSEWDLFVNGLDSAIPRERETVFDVTNENGGVPDWLTNEIWIKCGHLERLVPAYSGLRQSMLRHSCQWKEYFSCKPVLLAPVPGPDLQELSFCQKDLLWRVVLPGQLAQVCRDLVVYELGASTAKPDVYSAEEVLQKTGKHIPLVFVLPRDYHDGEQTGMEGHALSDPLSEITLYCKREGAGTIVNTVSLGDRRQMNQAVQALQASITTGHWLILSNCQAVDQWSEEFLLLIQHIVTPAAHMDKTLPAKPVEKIRDDVTSEMMSQTTPSQSSVYEGLEVHSNFKLIFITTADSKVPLPGLVIQNGMQVACETNGNFKATLRTYFNQAMAMVDQHRHLVTTTQAKSLTELVFCMALLHTVLSHRRLFHRLGFSKDYSWRVSDLKAMMSCLNWCSEGEGGSPWDGIQDLRHMVRHLVYGGHADILEDEEVIGALVDSLLQPWASLMKIPSSHGAVSLLGSLVAEMTRSRRSGSTGGNVVARRFQHLFDTMQDDVELAHLGLAPAAHELKEKRESRYLSDALQALERGKPFNETWYLPSLPKFLLSLDEELSNLPPLPVPSSESLSHLQNFFSSEVAILAALVERVQSDVDLALKAVVGEAAHAPDVDKILAALTRNAVPDNWRLPGNGVPAGRLSLGRWLEDVKKRAEALLKHQQEGEQVAPCYRLATFSHPQAFIDAVLLEYGRKEYLELHQLRTEIEITGMDTAPSHAPSHGVYVSGLRLHNASWNGKRALIQLPNPQPRQSSPLPILWLKPMATDHYGVSHGEKGSSVPTTYSCPVYSGDVYMEETAGCTPVLRVELPCTLDTSVWMQKRVYATFTL